jgi:hypothetical protein
MQSSNCNSFSSRSGATSRESQQSRKQCQSRKSRQARQANEPQPEPQTNPFEYTETHSDPEVRSFGPDKISHKAIGKLNKRSIKPSKQSAILEDYTSQTKTLDTPVPSKFIEIEKETDDKIDDDDDDLGEMHHRFWDEYELGEMHHHFYWDEYEGMIPDYLHHLKTCKCGGCEYGRNKY